MVLDPIPQPLPVHFFGSLPQPPTSRLNSAELKRPPTPAQIEVLFSLRLTKDSFKFFQSPPGTHTRKECGDENLKLRTVLVHNKMGDDWPRKIFSLEYSVPHSFLKKLRTRGPRRARRFLICGVGLIHDNSFVSVTNNTHS